ncbi:hypothetical protein [Paenibacillus campinasensis]|nr:hypothetical protein [Paenibacillus campinasensis]
MDDLLLTIHLIQDVTLDRRQIDIAYAAAEAPGMGAYTWYLELCLE